MMNKWRKLAIWLGLMGLVAPAAFGNVDSSGNLQVSVQGWGPSVSSQVTGNVASGAADSGNPVKTGGVYNSTQPTVTNGQRVDTQSTARGGLIVATGVDPFAIAGGVASGAADSGNPVKTGGVYNTAAPTLTNGQRGDTQMDSAANTKTYMATLLAGEDLTNGVMGITPKVPVASTYSPSSYQSAASGSQVVSANIKNAAGVLVSISYSSTNASARYLWITNATSAPAGALASSDASVIYILPLLQNTILDRGTSFFTGAGKYFSTGISFGFSTSATSYTAATASEHTLNANYF